MWYPVKACHIWHNFSIESDTLSRTVFELIAIQVLSGGRPPFLGGKVELWVGRDAPKKPAVLA